MSFRNKGYDSSPQSLSDGDQSDGETDRSSMASDYVYVQQIEEKKRWDKFVSTLAEAGSASEKHTDFIKKAAVGLKMLTTLITFTMVLASGVIVKATTFFIVAQMAHDDPVNRTVLFPNNLNRKELLFCPISSTQNATYRVSYGEGESVAWLWCAFFAFCAPEVLTWIRSVRIYFMRKVHWAPFVYFVVVVLLETLHTSGVAILFYAVLPNLDTPRAMMVTNAVLIIPGFLSIFRPGRSSSSWKSNLGRLLDILSALFQIAGLIVWPLLNSDLKSTNVVNDVINVWALPVGIFLTSFGWWESFVDENSWNPLSKYLWRVKINMIEEGTRYTTYLFVALWKIAVFMALFVSLTLAFETVSDVKNLFSPVFGQSFRGKGYDLVMWDTSYIDNTPGVYPLYKSNFIKDTNLMPLKVLAVQIFAAYACYIFGKFACKVNIQKVAFALPISLIMPVSLGGIMGMCQMRDDDPCAFRNGIPSHVFFECPSDDVLAVIGEYGSWMWFLWFLSSFWITSHIWVPKNRRLASTEQMFGTPYYSGLLLEQDITLNRRSDSGKMRFRMDVKKNTSSVDSNNVQAESIYEEIPVKTQKKIRKISSGLYQMDGETLKPEDDVTRIMGCATMWHENSEEMVVMIKSIFRMDEDYSARNLAKKILNTQDPDYYEWETHIFFDDAFEPDDSGHHREVNQFVRGLVSTMDAQGKKWFGSRKMKVPFPVKYPAPYGGRLVWTLPGSTRVVCHIKDKDKIRHKKRWSQIMYMYYFLGYRLEANSSLTQAQKELRARNTFLLALDGDVDFQPDAIIKLVDLMKRNPGVGASCGRIHPTGSGYMQWYQMFEYAIGHWLQKSTEHVLGCVLCSPGCFSLFRGEALMDDNVMNTYTTVSTEPRHFVQYDQGEDRWLCTLLLQQGWRVEYSAASDSFTACPEGFKEFYNQRRRWMPSTLANVMDLLGDYKRVIRNNDDISIFYIVYQIMMLIGTVLGPGSIFIMLAGSFGAAFGLDNWTSFLLNLIPLMFFIIACLTAKTDHQILFAQLLSVMYALVMMAVLIGILIQVAEDGWLAPTSLSLMFVAFAFIFAGLIHPQELACLPMGVIYYITIPSMYLFLVIYSVFNLNVVSWGTREVPKKMTLDEKEAEQVQAEADAKKKELKQKGTFLGSLFGKDNSSLEFSMRNLFHGQEKGEGAIKDDLATMSKKLDHIEMALKKEGYKIPEEPKTDTKILKVQDKPRAKLSSPSVRIMDPKDLIRRDDLKNPYWIEDEALGNGEVKFLKVREVTFWQELIVKYLKPLEKDAEKEKQIAAGLKELRNAVVFSFLMINSIWVLTIFLLQENKDLLYIRWPFAAKGPIISYDDTDQTIHLEYEYLQLEPIGLLFVVFFAVVLILQLSGMMLHRIMTLGHVVATTKIRMTTFGQQNTFDPNELINSKGVDIVKDIIRNIQPDDRQNGGLTIEEAVENSMNALAKGDDEEIRRMSEGGANWSRGKSALKRKETMHALRRRATEYNKRKATMKRSKRIKPDGPETIDEAAEEDDAIQNTTHIPIVRTNTYKDPEDLDERDV